MIETILVTGGAGYIGSHTARQLVAEGYNVVVFDNLSTGQSACVLSGEMVVGDLANLDCLRQLFAKHQFRAVLHFAASSIVPESLAQPLAYYANNVSNTLNLLRCCQEFGVSQLVFSSSAAVYGNPDTVPVLESAPLRPINPYGRSKLMSEWIIQDVGRALDLRYVILRYFNVAGAEPGGLIGQCTHEATHLIKVACEVALGKRASITIFGTDYPTADGTGVRDYVHVEDVAAAHIDALRYLQTGGQNVILNCGMVKGSVCVKSLIW